MRRPTRCGLASKDDATLVHAVDSAGRTEQRAARVSAPAAGADAVAEPQRRVGIHRPVRTRPLGGAASGERVPRADPGAVPHGVGAVRNPAPRRSDVVPQGVQGAGYLARAACAAAFRRGRPDRDRLGEQPAGGAPRRRLHRVQRGHHQRAAVAGRAGDDRAGGGPQRTKAHSPSASSATTPAGSSTPARRASGRRCGWSRCPPRTSTSSTSRPT